MGREPNWLSGVGLREYWEATAERSAVLTSLTTTSPATKPLVEPSAATRVVRPPTPQTTPRAKARRQKATIWLRRKLHRLSKWARRVHLDWCAQRAGFALLPSRSSTGHFNSAIGSRENTSASQESAKMMRQEKCQSF